MTPTRAHPSVLSFDGRPIVYWRGRPTKKVARAADGVLIDVPVPGSTPDWCAIEQGKPGEFEIISHELRAAIEADQKHKSEKD